MDLPAQEGVNEEGGALLSQQYAAIASAPPTASTATQLHDSKAPPRRRHWFRTP